MLYHFHFQTLLLEVRRELNSQTQGVQSILAERQKHLDLLAKLVLEDRKLLVFSPYVPFFPPQERRG